MKNIQSMKTTLWLTTFSLLAATPAFSKTEVETLRSALQERDRQIRQLEEENARLRSLQGDIVKAPVGKTLPVTTPAPAGVSPASSRVYTIQAGDTLSKIARKTGTSSASLTSLNGIKDPTKLQIGQKLKLPEAPAAAPATATAPASAPKPATSGETYIVRKGDTFYSIARKHNLSPDALVAANPSIKPSGLRAGQLIRLHGKAPAATASNNPAPAPVRKPTETTSLPRPEPVASRPATPAPAPAPAPAEAPKPATNSIRTVKTDGKMTYGEFATRHNTSIDRLNEINGLNFPQSTVLAEGSELYVNAQP